MKVQNKLHSPMLLFLTRLSSKETELDKLEARLRKMNKMAKFIRSEMANIPINSVLDKSAFNLDQALLRRPTFLEPEYPFEWTGIYPTKSGKYKIIMSEGLILLCLLL